MSYLLEVQERVDFRVYFFGWILYFFDMTTDMACVLDDFPEDFRSFFHTYGRLEKDVQGLMQELCQPVCSLCAATCCRYDICEEVSESPFLSLLQKTFSPDEYINERYGWLGPAGCLLRRGRPPICYAFFCDELLGFFNKDLDRYAAKTLGYLLTYIGERALGSRHLVEIMDREQLKKINTKRLLERAHLAQQAFQYILLHFRQDEIPQQGWDLLNRIRPLSRDLRD